MNEDEAFERSYQDRQDTMSRLEDQNLRQLEENFGGKNY